MFNIHNIGINNAKTKQTKKNKRYASKNSLNKSEHSKDNSFIEKLSIAEEEIFIKDVYQFVQTIEIQGERLKQYPNKKEFIKYKMLISKFLKKIVKESIKIHKQKVYKKDREYVTAKIIDEKLYELGHFVLLEEADTLNLAAKIDTIKGLIFDTANELTGDRL